MEGCESSRGWERGEFVFWAFVWGVVDPHGGGLGAGEPDGSAVVVKIRAPALLVCLGGGIRDVHACEQVGSLTVG